MLRKVLVISFILLLNYTRESTGMCNYVIYKLLYEGPVFDNIFQSSTIYLVNCGKYNNNSKQSSSLLKVDENMIEQCCSAHIVHNCQQYCSALFHN